MIKSKMYLSQYEKHFLNTDKAFDFHTVND